MSGCGRCEGHGSHRRWCADVVGRRASLLGRLSEQAEDVGDSIASNNMTAANHCYAAAALLRSDANAARNNPAPTGEGETDERSAR